MTGAEIPVLDHDEQSAQGLGRGLVPNWGEKGTRLGGDPAGIPGGKVDVRGSAGQSLCLPPSAAPEGHGSQAGLHAVQEGGGQGHGILRRKSSRPAMADERRPNTLDRRDGAGPCSRRLASGRHGGTKTRSKSAFPDHSPNTGCTKVCHLGVYHLLTPAASLYGERE